MIVCVCRGISDRVIRQVIDDGAVCLRELESKSIGDRCGMCVSYLREMIEEQTANSGAMACSQCCGLASVKTA